tara:strand:- start:4 stop:273 length:270 start_codon:yes stop_codon:yes gene_type:complete
MLDKKIQKQIIKKFKGKGGDPYSESSMHDGKMDKDHVSLFAMASLAAKIAERCWPAVLEARVEDHAVWYKIDRKYFRGLEYAFKVLKEE